MSDSKETTDLIERVARALKPAALRVFDEGYPVASNIIAVTAFLNAEKNVKRARKDAAIAIAICRGDRNE
jgi:hypothetical protein